MLELTQEECDALEKRVVEKLCSDLPDNDETFKHRYSTTVRIAIEATIATIREYERMKSGY